MAVILALMEKMPLFQSLNEFQRKLLCQFFSCIVLTLMQVLKEALYIKECTYCVPGVP